ISGAFNRAYEADPISIFGGIIACNREIDETTAKQMSEIFLEIVIAPNFTNEALAILTEKKNIRLIKMDVNDEEATVLELKSVKGGLLIQTNDDGKVTAKDLETVTERKPTAEESENLLFAWNAVKHM